MDEQDKQLTKLVVAHNKLAERKVSGHLEDMVQLLAHASPKAFETFCGLLEGKTKIEKRKSNVL